MLTFVNEENNKIGDENSEPDWSEWISEYTEEIALCDGSIDVVMHCRKVNDEDLKRREQDKIRFEHQELIDSLPDAVADLSKVVSTNTENTNDFADAIAELSEIVNMLVERVTDND